MKAGLVILFCMIGSTQFAAAQGPCVIAGRGHFYIHTGTAGLFGAFAHDHLIEAQRIDGCASLDSADISRSTIKLTFPAADIRVIDPKESAEDRAKIQKTMEAEVLRVADNPQIVFESIRVDRTGTDSYRVNGNLTIRGKTQPIVVLVTFTQSADGYRATGSYSFKQSTFGIRPVQLAAGTVKVKDEVRIEFELFLK